jgi:superfamily II DNA/RNA helicase
VPPPTPPPTRDEIVLDYIATLPFTPYPVQEQAIYAWAECEQGVLLSAPTGTGKTLVAEAAIYEALRTGTQAYYSTPLIALTDQKLLELQATVARWGFAQENVGLITGNRAVNPDAPVKVVVAEVLLNRLLHQDAYDFSRVSAVVMDEFHNFNEPQRGIVWELALSLLPASVRVMLLSATVGSADEFVNWMFRALGRRVTLVEGKHRRVPLHYHWIGDELLPDFIERMAQGVETARRTPALVFCFDRNICWDTAEVLKGKDLMPAETRKQLLGRLEDFDFKVGAGNKLRNFLTRGIGIHHAGLLPRYRRVVETLFQEKLLPICVCTETLAAGINLPARAVVLTTLVKGPRDRKKLIEASAAQQMFGRAGRPQFDTEGHVFAVAHEDDVKISKWQKKYDSIPETEKDPGLMAAKKQLLKKKPTRRNGEVYWNADQFLKLQTAPPSKLGSRGRLTWRWLAYLLEADSSVERVREVVRRRLMDVPTVEGELKRLTRMLVTLSQLDIIELDPPPPEEWSNAVKPARPTVAPPAAEGDEDEPATPATPGPAGFADLVGRLKLGSASLESPRKSSEPAARTTAPAAPMLAAYDPVRAVVRPRLSQLTTFRAVHPLYGMYLLNYLGRADDVELVQVMESLLEIPGTVARFLRVPRPEDLPPGRLTLDEIDALVLTRGIIAGEDLYPPADQSDTPPELRKYPIPLGDKLRLLFESEVDHAGGLFVTPVWAAGDFLMRGGSFDAYIRARDLTRQEGLLFKHFLRLVLLCREFAQLTPVPKPEAPAPKPEAPAPESNAQAPESNAPAPEPDATAPNPNALAPEPAAPVPESGFLGVTGWTERLAVISERLTIACREVDPQSTDELLEEMAVDA